MPRSTYWLRVRYWQTGLEAVLTFDHATTRAIAVFMLERHADVLAEGMGTR